MHRNSNSARLICDSACNRLTNPPCCICTELIALRVIEFLNRTNQTNITFLDQIQQAHTTTNILLRHADDQTQISFGQTTLRLFPILYKAMITLSCWLELLYSATFHSPGQTHFFLSRKQRDTTDLAQVHTNRIIQTALKVSNYNSNTIMEVHPLGLRNSLSIYFIFRSRLPTHWWPFSWIQSVHSFFVL